MTDIRLDNETLNFITMFERTTRVSCVDCVVESDMVVFLVPKDHLLDAIGKNGENVKKLRSKLNRKVRVVGLSDDPVFFLKSLFKSFPIESINLEQMGKKRVAVIETDAASKGKIIGKGGKNLQLAKTLMKRHDLPVDEISVK